MESPEFITVFQAEIENTKPCIADLKSIIENISSGKPFDSNKVKKAFDLSVVFFFFYR